MSYVQLDYIDLLIASFFLLINGAISFGFTLGIGRNYVIAAARMIVQLGAIGFILKFVFAQTSPWWTIGLAIAMIIFAGREAVARQTHPFKGAVGYGIGAGTVFISGTLATLIAVALLIEPTPWYRAQYVLPILGMILGNTLTGVALTLETLTSRAKLDRAAIEGRLALGATRTVAMRPTLRQALRTGLIPIINAMAASGIVSLPGMMTGQILAGIDPVDATKYQILIMFLIAGATGLGVLLAGAIGARLLTDARHRLRLDRLQ